MEVSKCEWTRLCWMVGVSCTIKSAVKILGYSPKNWDPKTVYFWLCFDNLEEGCANCLCWGPHVILNVLFNDFQAGESLQLHGIQVRIGLLSPSATWSEVSVIWKRMSEIWNTSSPTNRGPKNHLFWMTSQLNSNFNGLYLLNETRYRQSVKCVENYKVSPTSCQNVMNFGPQTASNSTCIFTHSM